MWIVYSRAKSKTKFISRGISYFTRRKGEKLEHVPSHMALVFGKRFMLEAVGGAGVRLNFFPTFCKQNDIVEIYDYKRGKEIGLKDKELIIEGCNKYHGQKYDHIGVMWFLFQIIKRWLFKLPYPKENTWDGPNRFFCTELMEFIDSRDHETSDPNSQMKMVAGNQDDYLCLYSAKRGDKWDNFYNPIKEELDRFKRK